MKQKNILILVLTLLLIGGGLAMWNATRQTSDIEITEAATTDPTIVGQNVEFTVTEGEVKRWTMKAVQATYNDAHSEADLIGVTGQFFDADGKPIMTFTAPKGHYANQDNAVKLEGGVAVKSTDAKTGSISAPTMIWSAKNNEVLAEGGVEMDYPSLGVSKAGSARFTLDFSKISLEGGVSSEIAF